MAYHRSVSYEYFSAEIFYESYSSSSSREKMGAGSSKPRSVLQIVYEHRF